MNLNIIKGKLELIGASEILDAPDYLVYRDMERKIITVNKQSGAIRYSNYKSPKIFGKFLAIMDNLVYEFGEFLINNNGTDRVIPKTGFMDIDQSGRVIKMVREDGILELYTSENNTKIECRVYIDHPNDKSIRRLRIIDGWHSKEGLANKYTIDVNKIPDDCVLIRHDRYDGMTMIVDTKLNIIYKSDNFYSLEEISH